MSFLKRLAVALLLSAASVSAQPITFCGDKECTIVVRQTCKSLARENNFQGSCCSLVDVRSTGQCRVTVAGGGNCGWSPKCGVCPEGGQCNIEYSTESTDACPESDYEVLAPLVPATPAPSAANGTAAPTAAPSEEFECPEAPIDDDKDESKDDSEASAAGRGTVHSATILALAGFAMLI